MSAQLSADPLCYWVLLTETLHLCYTSPSFNAVVPNWRLILGRRFLDYLNPKANAPETIAGRLRKVFNDEEDNGAIINCQYATVRAIRHHLDTTHFYPDQDDFTFTKHSFVASRAGGFLLVFLHIKTETLQDCGFDLCEPLKSGDLSTVTQYLPPLDSQPPYHVFQILSDDEQRHIIFSTPTTLPGRVTIVPSSLAEGTQSPRESWTNHFDTSCTNRTKALFMINTLEGNLLNVSCIIVRHGHAFLVMYRLTPFQQPPPASSPTEVRYMPPPGPPVPYNTHSHAEYRRLSLTSEYSQPSPIQQTGALGSLSQHNDIRPAAPHSPIPIRHRSRASSIRRNSYATDHPESPGGQTIGASRAAMNSDQKGYFHGAHSQSSLQSPTDPPFMQGNNHVSTSLPEHSDMAANNLRGRPAKDPPKGVVCCRSCHTTVTPEWRKGPTGVKDMCNACGLRWNRRVKKFKGEGGNLAETFETLIPGAEGSLEPQRSGGGSKKGHRKKAAETRGPALTTRPPKRRHSDANLIEHSGINSQSLPEDFSMLRSGGTQDSQYPNTQPHHPHNPHYSQESPNRNSRPHLPPLFDDQNSYPTMNQQTPLSSGVSYSTQADSPLKSPQSPSSPPPAMGFYQDNVDEGRSSGGSRKQSLIHPYRPSTSLTNGTRDHSTPLLSSAHIYHPAQDLHQHSHSPELARQASEPQIVPGPDALASRR